MIHPECDREKEKDKEVIAEELSLGGLQMEPGCTKVIQSTLVYSRTCENLPWVLEINTGVAPLAFARLMWNDTYGL